MVEEQGRTSRASRDPTTGATDLWIEGDRPRGRLIALDLCLGAVFALGMALLHLSIGVWAAVAALLLGGALAVRRWRVAVMTVAAVLAGAVQVGTGEVAYLADAIAFPVLFHALGSHRDPRWRRAGLAAAIVATPAAGVVLALDTETSGGRLWPVAALFTTGSALFTFGGWAAGYVRWQRTQALQARAEARLAAAEQHRLAQAVEQQHERAQIAADMHDVVAHSWAVVAAQADGARFAIRTSPEATEQALTVIADTARSTIGELRTILAQLRYHETDATLPDDGRRTRLLEGVRASGMRVEITERGTAPDSALLAMTAHRLLAEALTNALKHGDLAQPVIVHEDWTDGYTLDVLNAVPSDGRHPLGRMPPEGTGHGIIGMTERAAVAGGRLSAGREGPRWRVHAVLPAVPGVVDDEPTQEGR